MRRITILRHEKTPTMKQTCDPGDSTLPVVIGLAASMLYGDGLVTPTKLYQPT
jgi:hypothetical protein